MKVPAYLANRETFSWAFYDWANSAFATVVLAGFFPVFFREYWRAGSEVTQTTLYLGGANSAASLVIALMAPLLGAIADKSSAKKRFLLLFAAAGIVMTGGLYFIAQGNWPLALVVYAMAAIGFSGANVFYDALIINVAKARNSDHVSAFGYALGYLGGGVLFALCVWITLAPGFFGLPDAAAAVRLSFLLVAGWWALFSIPILLFVHEKKPRRKTPYALVVRGVRQLRNTFRDIRRYRYVLLFLAAYWLYIDGVDTVARMAVDYGLSLGFDSGNLIIALLITQFIGFPAAIGFGHLAGRIGTKRCIGLAIFVYIGVSIWGYYMDRVAEFYVLAVVVGLVQGGVQALSRSLFSRIIPRRKATEFFGFYNMLGKFAAVIGPLMMGWVAVATGNPRYGILSVIVLFVLGGGLLYFVDVPRARKMAGHTDAA